MQYDHKTEKLLNLQLNFDTAQEKKYIFDASKNEFVDNEICHKLLHETVSPIRSCFDKE